MNNIRVQKSFFYIMLIIMAVSIAVPGIRQLSSDAPEAVNGTLDLRNYDTTDKTVKLSGEWEFYFDQLLTPSDFKSEQPAGRSVQKLPSSWRAYQIQGINLPSYGTATYRLKILLPDAGDYGIKITCITASARVFADDRQIIACGRPGDTPASTVHQYYADTGYFSADKDETEIIVQVANYLHSSGGIRYEIYFGGQQAITFLRLYHFFIDVALISGLFFMSVYFFGLGLQRKRNREALYFASYCLFSAIYAGTCSEGLINYAFRFISYTTSLKIMTFSLILNLYSLFKYVYYAFKVSYSRWVNMIINGITVFFVLLTCFTNFYISTYASSILFLGNIYVISLTLRIILKYIHTNIEGRYYLYTATFSSVILLITSFCVLALHIESNFFIPVFQPIFVLSLALYMSEKYENSYITIEELSERLVVLDKLKDDFLAKTSHELKTPLNGIINISQSLLDGAGGSLNVNQTEDIRLITRIGKRLSTLVYDILDYSRLKVMDIKLNITCLDVHQVVESTVEIFSYLIKGKPVILENKIPPDQYIILADENRLKQIITNLLDNSVKFTAQGSIVIDCRQDGEFLLIEIRDTGIGIPESKLKDIFTSYEQIEEQSTGTDGTGIGLTITKQLVELHQGQIFAQSEPGQGACFTFSMPLAKDNKLLGALPGKYEEYGLPQPSMVEKLPHTVNVGGEFFILAVDDEYSNLKALLNILTVCQYNVTIAGNAESALNLLKGPIKYNLCILDVMMPGMSGYEACRKVREVYSPLELPVLMLTAKALPEDLEAGFMSGANDFIQKPFEIGELKCRVNTLVQLKKSMDLLLEKETAFLQAQIRPHFLFNALNTISSFCYTNPAKAGELLSELGVFLRNTFDFSSTSSFIAIEKELRLVKAYVAIEQARFGKRLEMEYNIDPAVLKYSILPLLIQPIVENSIRHGLMKRNQGGKVALNLTLWEGRIKVEVIDNGVGMAAPILKGLMKLNHEGSGVGLKNVNRRLLSFYGSGLEISSAEGQGTAISFNIPARYS
ncbi:sensor protein TorS [Oxobacter pfennigii]|uniref:Circadian input-output histidine kinase CikA n=1 Tax=Oxobacter pfennigii TaxID=36849 RepID=A0A0P9AGR8_9CLOT|nr:ATP-binding protein [Oxobacter pfennigii]KPU44641.1 sensor protein TorS [Oxobacter pfennigii]